MWLHPLHHSLRPGDHATAAVVPRLPPELTMLNDLSVFTDAWRKKVPYGDTEGDAHKHWPADPKAYFLYFMDDGTYGKETRDGAEGFWLRGARRRRSCCAPSSPYGGCVFESRVVRSAIASPYASAGWSRRRSWPRTSRASWCSSPGQGFRTTTRS